jgi:hypothetical protein
MSDAKDNDSFLRKVVRFVANPTTDWADLNSRTDEVRETEYAKSELKAMIERKRRNDFVRKREFDMLRRVRREGLSGDQLAALATSRLDDSEPRLADSGARQGSGVKAKIDEIEQQMVGDHYSPSRGGPEFHHARTAPAPLEAPRARATAPAPLDAELQGGRVVDFEPEVTVARSAAPPLPGRPPLEFVGFDSVPGELSGAFSSASSAEVVHDPDLDESVIAFANADFEQCEQCLHELTATGGARSQHAETWLVLFDFYRATGQQHKFESLALDYAQQFGWSAPQWFSMPRLVAEAAGEELRSPARVSGQVGWICPEHLDAEGVAELASLALQMPLPWVFDWGSLKVIDVEACARLSDLFRSWMPQDLDMRWLTGERLFSVLQEAAPTGARDADPAYWQVRLDALRMANRPDQFDEAAIDYCVTYEVSPPSWEPVRCRVRVSGSNPGTTQPPLSLVSEVSTSFQESLINEDAAGAQVGTVELSGQLVGDIAATLSKLDARLGTASIVNVSCARLIRVDFIAAGDLLNWVLARRGENRAVNFVEAHRMVALFFGAMGINEHAAVKVRTV